MMDQMEGKNVEQQHAIKSLINTEWSKKQQANKFFS